MRRTVFLVIRDVAWDVSSASLTVVWVLEHCDDGVCIQYSHLPAECALQELEVREVRAPPHAAIVLPYW